jgi:hypothetical protein
MTNAHTESRERDSVLTRDVDEVFSSFRELTHSGGTVLAAGGAALERELNMAIRLSEQIRDSVLTAKSIEQARAQKLNKSLRADGHRIVDVLADVTGVAAAAAVRLADGLLVASRAAVGDAASGAE